MERISKVIGKPVLSIFDGQFIGNVKNIFVDEKLKRVAWLCIFDEDENEKVISTKDVFAFEGEAIMIKNITKVYSLNLVDTGNISLLGYKIYTLNGKVTGKITDFEVDECFNIKNIFEQNDELFEKSSVLKIGTNIVIQKTNKNDRLSDFKPKQIVDIKITENRKVTTMKVASQNKMLPKKLLTDSYNFLLGRKVGQNIYAENGALLAKKHSKITSQLIDTASQNAKLKELTISSIQ